MTKPIDPFRVEKCPVCEATKIIKAGKNGEFLACPNFPKCPGKVAGLSVDQRRRVSVKLREVNAIVNKVGGIAEARKWLSVLEATKALLQKGTMPDLSDVLDSRD